MKKNRGIHDAIAILAAAGWSKRAIAAVIRTSATAANRVKRKAESGEDPALLETFEELCAREGYNGARTLIRDAMATDAMVAELEHFVSGGVMPAWAHQLSRTMAATLLEQYRADRRELDLKLLPYRYPQKRSVETTVEVSEPAVVSGDAMSEDEWAERYAGDVAAPSGTAKSPH